MEMKTIRFSTPRTVGIVILALCVIGLLSIGACTTTSPPPQPTGSGSTAFVTGVPGGITVNTVTIGARVKAIDPSSRNLTLLKPDGETITIGVGPEAVNFDQIRKGDLVKTTITEETLVYLDEEDEALAEGTAGVVALAPEGAKPGGLVAETRRMTAVVVAIDRNMHTARLEFDDGSSKTFPVRDDIDLSRHKVGEKVVFQITEAVAISVEPQ